MNKKIVFLLSGLLSLILFTGCGKLGYSLVLWNNPEVGVHEGQIVKVYVKSNISHSYIIMGLENTHKVEIPLWQISEPQSKSKTEKLAARYSNYEHTYANVKLDGLPIRSGTENGSKQVYRLRKNEVIRVLYQGKGVKPTNGHGELPGEWLRVLTETGTEGWCYSYNLNLFERTENQIAVKTEVVEEKIDEEITAAFSKKWYPEEYKSMLSSGRLDLSKMDESFGFDFGQVEWKYPEKSPEEGEYVTMTFEQGVPKSVNGKEMKVSDIIRELNRLGGKHGIGIVDIVENRVVGMKSRGVYETPGGTILYEAHQQLEELILDRDTYALKMDMGNKLAQIVYEGKWFSPLREAVQAFIESTQKYVTGEVKFKLYKGNIIKAGTTSPYSLYNESIASFTTGDLYDHHDAEGFINLFGLSTKVRAMKMQEVEGK